MTVIPFPVSDTASRPSARMMTPAGCMVLLDLLDTDFPDQAQVDADTGALILTPGDAEALNAFFGIFGLKLPASADAVAARELWHLLRFHYGRIVRVVLAGLEPSRFCPEFDNSELAFGRTVAQGEVEWAGRLARSLLVPRGLAAFLK